MLRSSFHSSAALLSLIAAPLLAQGADSVEVTPPNVTRPVTQNTGTGVGACQQFLPWAYDATGSRSRQQPTYVWSVSNSTDFQVDPAGGNVCARQTQLSDTVTTTVTATIEGTQVSGTANFTVTPDPAVPPTPVAAGEPQAGGEAVMDTTLGPPSAAASAPPTGLRADPTPNSIKIRWSCPAGATGYEVYATPKGGARTKITPTPVGPQCVQDISTSINQDPRLPAPTQTTYTSSYTHGGLSPTAEFTYVVRALYPSGFRDSDPVSATTPLWPAPTGLVAAIGGPGQSKRSVNVTWHLIPGAPGYLVFRKKEGQPRFAQLTPTPVPAPPFQDGGCQGAVTCTSLPVGEHRYFVRAVDGEPSREVAVLVGKPTEFKATVNPGLKTIVFTWEGTSDATAVKLQRSGNPGGPFTDVPGKDSGGCPCAYGWAQENNPLFGGTQYYRVVADYPRGPMEGEPLRVDVPQPPQGITNLKAAITAPGTVELTWTCDPAAIGYNISRESSSSTWPRDWIRDQKGAPLVVTKCSYTDTGLSSALAYTYSVFANYPYPFSTAAHVTVKMYEK